MTIEAPSFLRWRTTACPVPFHASEAAYAAASTLASSGCTKDATGFPLTSASLHP